MNRILLALAIAFQFLVLAWMVSGREYLLATGQTVWLRTAPVDPRDLFRGDYVTLEYEIATVPESLWSAEARKAYERNDIELPVYVTLEKQENGVAKAVALDVKKPVAGLFIKGRINPSRRIAYGIDAYFVEQDQGKVLEARQPEGVRQGLTLAREMEVAVGGQGTAALKGGFRWSGLGGCTEAAKPGALPGMVQFWFYNATGKPVTLVLPEDGSTIELGERYDYDFRHPEGWKPAPLGAADLLVIPPGQEAGRLVNLGRAWEARRKELRSSEEPFHPLQAFPDLYVSVTYKPPAPERLSSLGLETPAYHEGISLGRWVRLFPEAKK